MKQTIPLPQKEEQPEVKVALDTSSEWSRDVRAPLLEATITEITGALKIVAKVRNSVCFFLLCCSARKRGETTCCALCLCGDLCLDTVLGGCSFPPFTMCHAGNGVRALCGAAGGS